jgi:hypothetical protein
MAKSRLSDAAYAALADSYEAEPVRADEVISVDLSHAVLRKGRPSKGTPSSGQTPALTIRLPGAIRQELDSRVNTGESDSASELVRQALVEYFANHPVA